MYSRTRAFFYLSVLALLPRIRGVNVTIDDQYGDPTTGQVIQYNPPEAWQSGQGCSTCTAKPSPASNANDGTWMDATFFPAGSTSSNVSGQIIQASVPFIGTAVYVRVILTGSTTTPDGNSDYTFLIDNATAGVFQQAPNGDTSYKFNQTVFNMTGLSNTLHTLTIEVGHGGQKALALLDSIIYTKKTTTTGTGSAQNPSASSESTGGSSRSNIGIIVGPVIGGVIVAGSILALLFFLRRRRQGQRVRVLIDSPPMGSFSPTSASRPPGDGQSQTLAHIEPYVDSDTHALYTHSNGSNVYTASARGAPTATGSRIELSYGPSMHVGSSEAGDTSQHFATQTQGSSSAYGEIDEAAIDAATPLTAPPTYSEVESIVSSASRLPNPYGKGNRVENA